MQHGLHVVRLSRMSLIQHLRVRSQGTADDWTGALSVSTLVDAGDKTGVARYAFVTFDMPHPQAVQCTHQLTGGSDRL
jgi:hypothetical protein